MTTVQAIRDGQNGLDEKFDNIISRTDELEENIVVLQVHAGLSQK